MRLWLVRHGETQHNIDRVFQGQLDTPLTERGVQQAQHTADALATVEFERIFASDLVRAHDTARPLARQRATEIELDERLREMHYGVLQGVAYTEFQSVLASHGVGDSWGSGVFSRDGDAPPGGESLADLVARVSGFLEDVAASEGGSANNVAIVTHGGTIRTMMAVLLELPAKRRSSFALSNCGVTRFADMGAAWQLDFHNRVYWGGDLVQRHESV